MDIRLEYDRDVQALYVYLRDLPFAYNKELDERRIIDYAADNRPIGIEFLGVDHGVDLRDLPEYAAIGHLLEANNIKIFA